MEGERGFSALRGGRGPGWSGESAVARVAATHDVAVSGGRVRRGLGLRVSRREAWVYRRVCGKPWKGFRKESDSCGEADWTGRNADWSEGHGSGGCRGNGQQPAVAGQGEFLDRAPGCTRHLA